MQIKGPNRFIYLFLYVKGLNAQEQNDKKTQVEKCTPEQAAIKPQDRKVGETSNNMNKES